MLKRTKTTDIRQARTLRIADACQRYSLGKDTMRQTAATAGAVIRIGKVLLIDTETMDNYLEQQRLLQQAE